MQKMKYNHLVQILKVAKAKMKEKNNIREVEELVNVH
jgi:hypothetical protein